MQLIGQSQDPLPLPGSKPFRRLVQMVFQDPYGSLHPVRRWTEFWPSPGHPQHDDVETDELPGRGGPGALAFYPQSTLAWASTPPSHGRWILEPQILLLDEPTSALDASVQAEVLNLLEDLRARRGLTFVMVSHDLAVVTHLCERLMVMQRGQTVELLSSIDLAANRVSDPYNPYPDGSLQPVLQGLRRDWRTSMIKWEAHACLPLHPQASFVLIDQLRDAGVHYVSVNVGMDMKSRWRR